MGKWWIPIALNLAAITVGLVAIGLSIALLLQ